MSAPAWLPPLNSHHHYVTTTKVEEAQDMLDLDGPLPVPGKGFIYLNVKVSVKFFDENNNMLPEVFTHDEIENNKTGFLHGLNLDRMFFVSFDAALTYGCATFENLTREILMRLNIPFKLYPIRFLETDYIYTLQEEEHEFLHRFLAVLSNISLKSRNIYNIVPVRWHIFKHVTVSENEYNAWNSWYEEKSRADPNFVGQYKEAISRPRTTEELLYEEMIKFKAATSSSIQTLELVKVDENFDSTSNYCSVCLEGFCSEYEAIRLPCSHVFHSDCIIKWLQESHMCPLCRFALPTSVNQ